MTGHDRTGSGNLLIKSPSVPGRRRSPAQRGHVRNEGTPWEDIAGMSHTSGGAADTILAASPRPADSRLTEPVVVVVGEAAGDPAGEFDEPVHGLGAAVG